MTPHDPHDDQELQFHLEMLTRRYIDDGLAPDEARARAEVRMGDLRAAAEARRMEDARGATRNRYTDWFRGWGQDFIHAYRVLRRAPGFVAIAVVMLGLGTGASTAVFSVVDAVLLRSAFADPDSTVLVYLRRDTGQLTAAVPRDAYDRLATQLPAPLAAIGYHSIASPIVTDVDIPRRTQVECLTPSMARILGTPPAIGRWFADEDGQPGAPLVAVVSHVFWRGVLGGDPRAIGRVVRLDDTPVTILGVMPPGFNGPLSRINRDIWVPYGPQASSLAIGCRPVGAVVNVIARIDEGVTPAIAGDVLSGAAGVPLVFEPLGESTISEVEGPLQALIGAVCALLLIAFVNVTNLGLERLASRRREVAVRLALGATRARVIRETVAEHIVISLAGAAAGILIALIGFDAMIRLLPASLPNLDAVALNVRVLLTSTGLAVLGGVIAGCLAAWHAASTSAGSNLAAGDRGHTERHSLMRRALVTAELALGVLLLVGALLMVRTFFTLRPGNPGFDVADKHIALIRLPPGTSATEHVAFVNGMRDQLSRQPGIRAVEATTSVPWRRSVAVLPATIAGTKTTVYTGAVTPRYFDLMDVPIRRGRGLSDDDHAAAGPVAVVNETFAARWFPGVEPLGQTFTLGDAPGTTLRIVGIVADMRSFGGDTTVRPFVYMPLAQADTNSSAFLMLDVDARAARDLPASVRAAVTNVRPGLLVDELEPLIDEMNAEVAYPRLGAWLFGAFASLAVLLAAVGLAATLAWSVAQRRREIGIRVALGATGDHVRRLILGQTMAMSLTGITLGLLGAAWATQLLAGWLYGVSALDPWTFAACGAFMLVVALMAAWLPTRRATRIDPAITLRGDAS